MLTKKFYVRFDKTKDRDLIQSKTMWSFDKNDIDLSIYDFSKERNYLKLLGSDTTVFPLELYCDYNTYTHRHTIIRHTNELKKTVNTIENLSKEYDIDFSKLRIFHEKLYSRKKRQTIHYDENMNEVYRFFNSILYVINYGDEQHYESLINMCKMIDIETDNKLHMFEECFRLISIVFDDCNDDTSNAVAIIPFIRNKKHEIGKCNFDLVLAETFFGSVMRKRDERAMSTMISGYISKSEYEKYKSGLYWKHVLKETVKKEMKEELSTIISDRQIIPLIKRVINSGDFNKEVFVFGVDLTPKNMEEIKTRKMICEETTKIEAVNVYHFVHVNERTGWRGDAGFRKSIIEKLYKELYVPNAW